MEKIEALVEVLGCFAKELSSVRELIGDIENNVQDHTANLKNELMKFKQSLNKEDNSFKAKVMSEAVPNSKIVNNEITKPLSSVYKVNHSLTNGFSHSNGIEEVNNKLNPNAKEWTLQDTDFIPKKPSNRTLNDFLGKVKTNEPAKKLNFWQEPPTEEELQDTIDWEKEEEQRKTMENYLLIKEGWMHVNSSVETIENHLKNITGRFMSYYIDSIGKDKNTGKVLLKVRFDKIENCKCIYERHKEIGQEGHILVGEALTHIERKERWRMLTVAESLRVQGCEVEFENKRICVNGTWWKYKWQYGWESDQNSTKS